MDATSWKFVQKNKIISSRWIEKKKCKKLEINSLKRKCIIPYIIFIVIWKKSLKTISRCTKRFHIIHTHKYISISLNLNTLIINIICYFVKVYHYYDIKIWIMPSLGEIIRSIWWTSDVVHHSTKKLPLV